jgi:hypothetical protein
MRRFVYTPEQINCVELALSPERLGTYLARTQGDKREAVLLYEKNTALSEALYGVLQGVEVTVRNAMHNTMTICSGRQDWYDHAGLCPAELERVQEAKDKITQNGRPITPSRVVAGLMFGFWSALLAKHYSQTLWIPCLHRAFPRKALGHRIVHERLSMIRFIRNRVAHHECILSRDLEDDYLKTLETVSWICSETAQWIRETTRFEQRFKECYGRSIIVI